MKRIFLLGAIIIALGAGATSTRAGGHCGGGGGHCGGGHCGGGGWCGSGWHCGGGGWCGSGWSFGIGLNFGYPAYSYRAYAYAPATYVYVQPSYAYSTVYTPAATVVATAPTVKAVATVPVYVRYMQAPQAQQRTVVMRPATPAPVPSQPANGAGSRVQPGGWVLDKNPYVYTPALAAVRPASVIVSRSSASVPVYVVSR
jgi:hypothetical protein